MVRCKFVCVSKEATEDGFKLLFTPVISGSKENDTFFSYTPYGGAELGIVSKETAEMFEKGKEYYLDFTVAN